MSKTLRNTLVISAIFIFFTGGTYLLIFNWLVPKTAVYAVPMRWTRIPLRQSKTIVRAYFGAPSNENKQWDEWAAGTRTKEYKLRIYYVNDSMATAFSISYHYKSRLVNRNYLLDSASIR